jgi:hypothetical protein
MQACFQAYGSKKQAKRTNIPQKVNKRRFKIVFKTFEIRQSKKIRVF